MNKADELKILADAAKKLGKDSYLGDALLELLPFVESEMRSDIFPDLAGSIRHYERRLVEQRKEEKELDAKIKEKREELRQVGCLTVNAESRLSVVKDEIKELVSKLNRCL